jgi:hypothetical protein
MQLQQAGEEGYLGSDIYLDLPPWFRGTLDASFREAQGDNGTLDMENRDTKGLSTMRINHVHSQMDRMAEAKTE